jgi:hypothetical protein
MSVLAALLPSSTTLGARVLLTASLLDLCGPPVPTEPATDDTTAPTAPNAEGTAAAPSTGVRSQDGSAELTALRALASEDEDISADEVEPADRRGLELEWGVDLGTTKASTPDTGEPTTPVPADGTMDAAEDFDVIDAADRSLTMRRGRRLFWAGFWMSFTGVLFGPGFLAGSVSAAKDEKTTPALVLGVGLAAPCFALLAAGVPLAIRGKRMEKHPERFTIRPAAGGLEVRF